MLRNKLITTFSKKIYIYIFIFQCTVTIVPVQGTITLYAARMVKLMQMNVMLIASRYYQLILYKHTLIINVDNYHILYI